MLSGLRHRCQYLFLWPSSLLRKRGQSFPHIPDIHTILRKNEKSTIIHSHFSRHKADNQKRKLSAPCDNVDKKTHRVLTHNLLSKNLIEEVSTDEQAEHT